MLFSSSRVVATCVYLRIGRPAGNQVVLEKRPATLYKIVRGDRVRVGQTMIVRSGYAAMFGCAMLWLTAACEQRGTKYSRFMYGLEEAGMTFNRKMLSEVAIADPAAFDKIVEIALAAIPV